MVAPFIVGTFAQDSGASVLTVVIPVVTGIATGIVVVAVNSNGGTPGKTFTCTDSKGNTYVSEYVNEDNPTNNRTCALVGTIVTPLVAGVDVITLTVSQSRANWAVVVGGFPQATAFDKLAQTSGNGTAMDSGPTANGAQAVQYSVGVHGWHGAGDTLTALGAGATLLGQVNLTVTSQLNLALGYLATVVIAAREASGTLSGSTAWASGVLALNETEPSGLVWYLPDGLGGLLPAVVEI